MLVLLRLRAEKMQEFTFFIALYLFVLFLVLASLILFFSGFIFFVYIGFLSMEMQLSIQ